jgi:hypothetical protein
MTPEMNLIVPGVGTEAGPTYASDINADLSILDGHDHSSGKGVQITPAGLNINSALTINNNDLTSIRTARFQAQNSTLSLSADVDCIYVTGVDLYYRDGNGNNVRITQSGNVAGTPGSISGLSSPASASYNSGTSTFVWQSAALTPANMDAASYIFRNLLASSKGLTLSPPGAMAADYTLTLPALPASQKIMTLDAAGNMSAPYTTDNSTLEISSNLLQVKNQGITQAKKALRAAATTPQATAGGIARSASINSSVNAPTGLTTAGSVSLTTLGNPVEIFLQDDGTFGNGGGAIQFGTGASNPIFGIAIYRDSTQLTQYQFSVGNTTSASPLHACSMIKVLDFPIAGTYTYSVKIGTLSGSQSSISLIDTVLVAYEL